jgi:tetratricopeptide (TPR) repeat protein
MALRFSGVILLGAMSAGALRADSVLAGSAVVLPFTNAGAPTPHADWLGDSIAESLREALISRGSPVVSRMDIVAAYADLKLRANVELTQASVLKLGQSMNADKIIYGTYRLDANGVLAVESTVSDLGKARLSAPLKEAAPLADLDKLEARLAWQAVAVVNPAFAIPEVNARYLRPPVRVTAEQTFIRGLIGPADQREKAYQEANKADPRFARPLLELGKIELGRKNYKAAADWLQKVDPMDLHYPESSFYFGVAKFRDGDYALSQAAFQRITSTLPAAEVFNNLGVAESRRNQLHALSSFRQALDLNPNQPDYHFNMGYILFKTGQYEAAAERFRAVLERDPGDQMATLLLGRSLKGEALRKGNPSDARFEAAERFKDAYDEPLYRTPADPSAERKVKE